MDAKKLLEKYNQGTCTDIEKDIVETWFLKTEIPSPDNLSEMEIEESLARISHKLEAEYRLTKTPRQWPRIAVAASIILAIFGAGIFYSGGWKGRQADELYSQEIAPGKSGATLTLNSGKQIILSEAATGELANEAGVSISKSADGELIYEIKNLDNTANQFNTLSTKNGETYRVRLPDQSEVWLNAASTLRYPASFTGSKERRVELNGEAYFQISKNIDQPFIVSTNKQELKVLGTHFNISAYPEEMSNRTTLLEGSLQLSQNSSSIILRPGQQAHTNGGKFEVKDVDAEEAIAWKNGYFQFSGKTLETAMLEISKWYDVEIQYNDNNLRQKKLAGTISKYEQISSVLKTMELTGALHFKIDGKKIIVK